MASNAIFRSMNEQLAMQATLKKKFLESQAKNKNYSVRAFAKRLGMQPGPTNEILKGQRRVSRKIAERIAEKLQLDPTERNELLRDFPMRLKRRSKHFPNKTGDTFEAMKISAEQFNLISDWIHFGILSLMKTNEFRHDSEWIAERFAVTKAEVEKAIERMISIGLIVREDNGEWKRTSIATNTTDDVRDLSLQKAHMTDMEIAKEKIQNIPVDKRDFSFLIFNANPKFLPKAKEILRKAQDDLEDLMDQEDATEVYKVCTYLYPLTNLEK